MALSSPSRWLGPVEQGIAARLCPMQTLASNANKICSPHAHRRWRRFAPRTPIAGAAVGRLGSVRMTAPAPLRVGIAARPAARDFSSTLASSTTPAGGADVPHAQPTWSVRAFHSLLRTRTENTRQKIHIFLKYSRGSQIPH